MGASQTNFQREYQKVVNNITLKSKEVCSLTTKSEASHNVVIVDHSIIKGDFNANVLVAETDGTCMLVNSTSEIAQDMLHQISNQSDKTATDMFGDFSINSNTNVSDVRQSMVNNMSNIFEGTCSSSQITSTNNNFVYVTGTTIGGNFNGITNKTDNKLTCTVSNTAKMASYNKAQASTTQVASLKGLAATLIMGIVIIVIVVWLGYYMMRAVGMATGAPPEPPSVLQNLSTATKSLADGADNFASSEDGQKAILKGVEAVAVA